MKVSPQVTGNAGLYYCCYKLSLLGWNVMPTARNARGVDIIAYNEDATRMLGIQVKSLSRRNPVPLGSSLEKVSGDFWIIVNGVFTEPRAFIMHPGEVKALALCNEKEGKLSCWLQPKSYDDTRYRERWDRIGDGTATV